MTILKNKQWELLTDSEKASAVEGVVYEYMDCPEKEKLILLINTLKSECK